MNRRTSFKTLATAALAAAGSSTASAAAGKGIQLHVDLNVDMKKEKQLLDAYAKTFAPAMKRQPGFTDTKLLKLNAVMKAPGPVGANYRLLVCFQAEAQRLAWVASEDHKKAWPLIEGCLTGFAAVLYDIE